MHVLTLIAPAGALTPAVLARVTEAVQGGPVTLLSPGEAADMEIQAVTDFVLQKLPRSK